MTRDANIPTWDPAHYGVHARFISAYGIELIEWLKPRPGERILDFGCGDGYVTEKIAACGAEVVGADHDPRMVEAARARGLDARLVDGTALTFDSEFNAVFSNSVLHWVKQPAPVVERLARALKPDGRLIADVPGLGNLAAVLVAMRAVSDELGGDPALAFPLYAPTAPELGALLEASGLQIERLETSPRYPRLPSELWNWIGSIFHPFFTQFDDETNQHARNRVLALVKPVLCDTSGQWHIDHVRVRVIARKPG